MQEAQITYLPLSNMDDENAVGGHSQVISAVVEVDVVDLKDVLIFQIFFRIFFNKTCWL